MNIPSETDLVTPTAGIQVIRASTWQPHAATLKHVFLAGNLAHPTPHPFFSRRDVELIWCEYEAGDHGRPHWHPASDEIEIVIAGSIGYRDIASEQVVWLTAGDVLSVPHGTCVERTVHEAARSLAIKLPSLAEKIHCRECVRQCAQRREEFYQS